MAIEEVQANADAEGEKEAKQPYTSLVSRCSQYLWERESEDKRQTIRQGNFANGDRQKSKFKYKLLQQETELSPPGREQQLPLGVDCGFAKYEYAYGSIYVYYVYTKWMEVSYQHRQLAHVRHVFHYRDNTLSVHLNPIPIPDSIPRICREFTPGIGSRQTQS